MDQPHKSLWHKSVSTIIASRRLLLRALFTLCAFALIFYIIHLLFFRQIQSDYRDILNVIIGAIIAVFGKVTDFWFKKDEGDDDQESGDRSDSPSNPSNT